jgi:hypothetical protein
MEKQQYATFGTLSLERLKTAKTNSVNKQANFNLKLEI